MLAFATFAIPELFPAVLTACSIAVACALLSVFVVARRWAFIGEGISHSGLGGAGTVWLLMLAFPPLDRQPWVVYVGVVVFCTITAVAIGHVTRARRTNSDAVIGIFMVASLAWGFLAQQIYHQHRGFDPAGWDTYLFGRMDVTLDFAIGSAAICAAVVAVVVCLGKEIVAYCFDPSTAEAAGVRVGLVHYLLMIMVSLTIVIGVRVAGSVLVTALLVLPGATALLLSQRLNVVLALSLTVGVLGAIGGLAVHWDKTFVPIGPGIVLVLFAQFVVAYIWTRIART